MFCQHCWRWMDGKDDYVFSTLMDGGGWIDGGWTVRMIMFSRRWMDGKDH